MEMKTDLHWFQKKKNSHDTDTLSELAVQPRTVFATRTSRKLKRNGRHSVNASLSIVSSRSKICRALKKATINVDLIHEFANERVFEYDRSLLLEALHTTKFGRLNKISALLWNMVERKTCIQKSRSYRLLQLDILEHWHIGTILTSKIAHFIGRPCVAIDSLWYFVTRLTR